MSEEKERESNDSGMISQTDKNEENRSKNEDGMAMSHLETPLLEDEEMPTYISVSTSSKCEDSDVSNTKQHDEESPTKEQPRSPCGSEQGGTSSVYLLSSGEETDPPYNDEDYGDSDDMEDIDLESEHDNAILDEEEDEDEMEDEDNEEEYKRDCYETASDCLGLKSPLKRNYKEKSLSLQDLSICQNYVRDQHLGRRNRYRHVDSKVKRYINDMKERNRYSLERRMKEQGQVAQKNHAGDTGMDVEQAKPIKTNKVIKDYAERAIKDLEIEETYANDKNIYMTQIAESDEVENIPLIEGKHKRDVKSGDINARDKEFLYTEEKNGKRNGSVQTNLINLTYSQPTLQRNIKFTDQNEHLVNGHQLTLFNLRTLTYDEYMHGNANYNQDAQLNKNMHIEQNENNDIQTYSDVDVMNSAEAENSNAPCPLKIENVKSIRVISEESKDNSENVKFEKVNEETNKSNFESMQITLLKTQLDQKTVQFNNLKDAYQSTLTENLKMKNELEALKMSLAKYDKETKVVAVQTDAITGSVLQQNDTNNTKETNKVSTSSITSVASSINQWTDSAGSSGISIKPPDLGTILNSEDSLVMTDDTPRKMDRPLSRAFITSSRILQTLSSITQGRSKTEAKSNSISVRSKKKSTGNEESEHVKENDGSILAGFTAFTTNSPSNTKKRKATEMLGSSTFLQPSKIPHITEMKRKSSNNSEFEPNYLKSDDNCNIRFDAQKKRVNNLSRSASPTVEDKNEKNEDSENQGSNVKCFIYREDENTDDQSILIQAEIPTSDRETGDTSCIRECGPYLLGNVEVHMSEINGTINIWGKEISQKSVIEEEEEEEAKEDDIEEEEEEDEELGVSTRSPVVANKRSCWQNTPHRKFNGSKIVCSTNKKGKLPPKFNEAHNSQYLHVPDRSNGKIYVDNVLSPSISASCGKGISSNHHKECSIDKRHTNLHEKSHSCCVHQIEHLERDYKCACDYERQKNNDSPCCGKEGFCTNTRKKFPPRNTSDFRKDFYENIISPTVDAKEVICKHRTMCRRSSLHNTEANFQNDMKCCNTIRETSHTCKSTLGSMGNQDNDVEHFCNRSPKSKEDELLIPERVSSESAETRKRRSSGKKVRGILMDLLKSCGDYRNASPSSSSKRCANGKEASHSINCSPQTNITSCNSPDVGCSSLQQSAERCCPSCARRIESQLEEFRLEIERIRSRSDAILDLLRVLHSVEMN